MKFPRRSFLFIVMLMAALASAVAPQTPFLDFVKKRIAKESGNGRPLTLDRLCPIQIDTIARRVFFDYGAMFVADTKVKLPPTCMFRSPAEVAEFQDDLDVKSHSFGEVEIELQEEAMESLIDAVEEAAEFRLRVTPLDGQVAGGRSYEDTVRIWNSRFFRALDYWVRKGKIMQLDADAARRMPVFEQVKRVVEWEQSGYYFNTNFSGSIFYSVAPPGTSQHLSLIAFDVVEAGNPEVRHILNKHGWFQTIRTDQPHFTYLGVPESELPKRGLQNVAYRGNFYWIPMESVANQINRRGISLAP